MIGGGFENTADCTNCAIGGGALNYVTGKSFSTIGGGENNEAVSYATVGGGYLNIATGFGSFIGGGGYDGNNSIEEGNLANGTASAICGGIINTIESGGAYSFIGGGFSNTASGEYSTIGGGQNNTANNTQAVVAGGVDNVASGTTSTVGGGWTNVASGQNAFIGGGEFNTASGHFSSVAGGANNTASGNYSFAGGQHANANYAGSFVWADDSSANPFTAATANSFNVRCTGGVTFASDIGGVNQQVNWIPGDASWNFSSDRNLKDRFAEINKEEILDKVAELPIVEWSYKNYSQRHIGTMAQEFHALFPLNTNDKVLNEADLNGVALAAVQGLNQKVNKHNQSLENELQQKNGEINDLKAKAAQTDKRLEELEAIVQSLQEK
jgi:hypothetical protein